MATVSTKLTTDDLWKMPDDGNRYELLDGEIVMSPAPLTCPLFPDVSIEVASFFGR